MPTLTDTWDAPESGPPDTYHLYSGPAPGQETLLATVAGSVRTYQQAGVAYGTYCRYVTATVGGVESGPSNETITTVRVPIPSLIATAHVLNGQPAIVLQIS